MSVRPEHLVPQESFLSRRDARWRLAAFVLAIGGVASLRHPGPAAAALAFALCLAALGGGLGRWYRFRLGALLIALVPFLIVVPFVVDRGDRLWEWNGLHVTDAGLWAAAALGMKTIALITLALTLLSTASPHSNLEAAARLGVPKLLVHITLLTYRYVFVLFDEMNRLRIALRVRGFRNAMTGHAYRTVGHVTGTLVVRGSDRAERVAQAMRCRGFDGRLHTTTIGRTRATDVLMFAAIVGVAGGLVAWDLFA